MALEEAQGVPVNRFEAGVMIRRWLINGPFEIEGQADPLASLGGAAAARPQPGSGVPYRGTTQRFVELPRDAVREIGGTEQKTEYLALPAVGPRSRSFLYALLETEQEQGCLIAATSRMGVRWAAVWIDGRRIADGTVVVLEPGLHRVLIEARGIMASPLFARVDAGAARAAQRKHQWLLDGWRAAKARHEQTGELQAPALILGMCRRGVRTWCLDEMTRAGDAGRSRARAGLPFIAACQMATGEALTPDTPLVIAARPELVASPSLDDRGLCFAMGIAPEELRARLKQEFRRRLLPDRLDRLSCLELVAALAYYPFDLDQGAIAPGAAQRQH